jgi:hypothetical protein
MRPREGDVGINKMRQTEGGAEKIGNDNKSIYKTLH